MYNHEGKRTNTREVRTRKKLESERHRLVQKMLALNPQYRPPFDYRLLLTHMCTQRRPQGSDLGRTFQRMKIFFIKTIKLSSDLNFEVKMASAAIDLIIFTARCYASAVLAMALCLSVRPSVRHKSVFY